MTIKIYRKRSVFNGFVLDDKPECVIGNITEISVKPRLISGVSDGNKFSVNLDHVNYHYVIV